MHFLFLVVAVSFTSVFACQDGVDNVITLDDCGAVDALVQFRNIKVHTYDENKMAKCFTDRGKEKANIFLPGFLKVSSGQVLVNQQLDLAANGAELFVTASEKTLGTVCKDGATDFPLIEVNSCKVNLCKLIGKTLCDLASKQGAYNIDDLDPILHDFVQLPSVDETLGQIIQGQWHGEMNIHYGGNVIGCIVLPGKPEEYVLVQES